MITQYLDQYKTLSVTSLLSLLNKINNNSTNKVIKILVISTILTDKYIKYFSSDLYSIDLMLTIDLSIIYLALTGHKFKDINEIDSIVKKELNIVSNTYFISNYYFKELDIVDPMINIIINEMKKEIIKSAPKSIKLPVIILITTGELVIENYSKKEKILFLTLMKEYGYDIMLNIKFDLDIKLPTVAEKVVFLHTLSIKHPELFVLLVTVKDVNTILMLSEFKMLRLPTPAEIIEIFDKVSSHTDNLLNDTISKEEGDLLRKVVNNIKFNFSKYSIGSLLDKANQDLYDKFDKKLSSVSNNVASISVLNNLLNSEVRSQINLISLLKDIK